MKKLIPAVAVAAMLAVPAVSFAQSSEEGLTHAQVQGELAQLESAGYSPTSNQDAYPANLQAAEQRIDAQQGLASGYGPMTNGTSGTGAPLGNGPTTSSFGAAPVQSNGN